MNNMTNSFLLNDFYSIESIQVNENKISATVLLNPNHNIFKGHFEQMPVVPGVCQTQLIKELLQQTIQKNVTLSVGQNIKFTGMIIPTQHPKFQADVVYSELNNQYTVEAQLYFENTIFTKFKGSFKVS